MFKTKDKKRKDILSVIPGLFEQPL